MPLLLGHFRLGTTIDMGRAMKRALWIATIVNAALVSGCGDCEYETGFAMARVSVSTPDEPYAYNCTNDPVEVSLTWDGHFEFIRTTDGRNPPRACIESLGLVDGAEVKIQYVELTSGQHMGIGGALLCKPSTVTLLDIDPTACDAACDAVPECPKSPPMAGQACLGSLSCNYGDPVNCPTDTGSTTTYHECENGVWSVVEKNNCDICGVSCQPLCSFCAEALSVPMVPFEQITFCTDSSEMLYTVLLGCMCTPGNPCEPVCNTAPAGDQTFCNGGTMTPECENCVIQTPQPDGCQTEFMDCANDF